jgi:hypothetical protein
MKPEFHGAVSCLGKKNSDLRSCPLTLSVLRLLPLSDGFNLQFLLPNSKSTNEVNRDFGGSCCCNPQ